MGAFFDEIRKRHDHKQIEDLIDLIPAIGSAVAAQSLAVYAFIVIMFVDVGLQITATGKYMISNQISDLLPFLLVAFGATPFIVGLVWRVLPDNMRLPLRRFLIFIITVGLLIDVFGMSFLNAGTRHVFLDVEILAFSGICFLIGSLVSVYIRKSRKPESASTETPA